MLEEIYIDNFRCLTNFRIRPAAFQLWLGDNGSGKTTVFDVLRKVKMLFQGRHVEDLFSMTDLTVWDHREHHTIEISATQGEDRYLYRLLIEHSKQEQKARIGKEELQWNGNTFFLYDGKDAHLYRVNRETGQPEEGVSFAADWSRSLIPTIAQRDENWPLLKFREDVAKWLIINPIPHVITPVAESESRLLQQHTENFSEWYRYVLQEKPGVSYRAKEELAEVLPGFEQMSLKEIGQARQLTVTFRINSQDREFPFSALSDGQRQLIVLYTILEALRAGVVTILLIDEPDNFVSLREIQPWVDNLQDICEEEDRQAVIISHHPEIINKMARGNELWFSRQEGACVQVKQLSLLVDLLPAEIVARGWENE